MTDSNNIFICPGCNIPVVVNQLRCGDFVHAIYKKNFKPVNPHISDADLNKLKQKNKIYGCGYKGKLFIA